MAVAGAPVGRCVRRRPVTGPGGEAHGAVVRLGAAGAACCVALRNAHRIAAPLPVGGGVASASGPAAGVDHSPGGSWRRTTSCADAWRAGRFAGARHDLGHAPTAGTRAAEDLPGACAVLDRTGRTEASRTGGDEKCGPQRWRTTARARTGVTSPSRLRGRGRASPEDAKARRAADGTRPTSSRQPVCGSGPVTSTSPSGRGRSSPCERTTGASGVPAGGAAPSTAVDRDPAVRQRPPPAHGTETGTDTWWSWRGRSRRRMPGAASTTS